MLSRWRPAESTLSDDEEDGDDDSEEAAVVELLELNARMREVIVAYGGAVFPKLNWSAPKVHVDLSFSRDRVMLTGVLARCRMHVGSRLRHPSVVCLQQTCTCCSSPLTL